MNTIAILAGIGAPLLTYAIVQWGRLHASPPLPIKRRRIASLDLALVRQKAMKRHGWDETKATALEAEYRDFLILLAENEGKTVSPWSDDLDLFWHEHILDTQRYARDCNLIFGHFVQHDPHIDRRPYHHEETKRATMALREAQLKAREERRAAAGATSSNDGFDVTTWGCSADTGHAHHTSGHACGGHGCGGHGCGGGH